MGTTCGHIEPVASGTGLATLYNLLRSENSTIENGQEYVQPARSGLDVVNRMNEGEHFARRVIEISATALGECIAGMANLLDPDVIVLSGSVVKAGEGGGKACIQVFACSTTSYKCDPIIQREFR